MRAVNSSTVSTAAYYDENGEIWRHAEAGANIKYSEVLTAHKQDQVITNILKM